MFDAVKLSESIQEMVVDGDQRKYYRFRHARYYGGIATADCVGCNLSCVYCWSGKPRKNPSTVGRFYTAKQVFDRMTRIAERHGYNKLRISGNEPTIGKQHLLKLLQHVPQTGFEFILETNGILLGHHPSYASTLTRFKHLHVRVSLKGCNPQQFSKLTGAQQEGFKLQLDALRNLVDAGVSCHPAVMKEFTGEERLMVLKRRLEEIHPGLTHNLEFEQLVLYPHVKQQLIRHDIHLNQ